MSALPRYRENARCPKCACSAVGTQYGRGGAMVRNCGRCGYEWLEAPLDTPDPEAPEPTR